MPTYLLLGTYEQPGFDSRAVVNAGNTPEGLGAYESLGITFINQWSALGPYEHVALVEADNEIPIQNACLLAKQAFGQRTQVVRLFDKEEAEQFIPLPNGQ